MTKSHETYWFFGKIKHESAQAYLIDTGEDKPVWIPKSQVVDSEDDLEVGIETNIEVPVWLAEEKNLI